jgi:hypothetical protein
MPLNLTTEEVARLSEEQLEAYARVHLHSERTRRELCDQASGRNRSIVVPIVASLFGVVTVVWFPSILRDPITLVFVAIALLFRFHLSTNRRIDALVRLLNIDRVTENQMAEQEGVAPNSSLPPSRKSTSPVRGPED